MNTIRRFFKVIFFIIEKVMQEVALLAAVFSITEPGTFYDRIVGGMLDIWVSLYEIIYAYVKNIGFRDFMTGLTVQTLKGIANVADNIQSNPRRVLIAFIATFATYKIIPLILRLIRKRILKRSGPDRREMRGSEEEERGGETFEHLYRNKSAE